MSILSKLQRKKLLSRQIVVYCLSLCIGTGITLTVAQLFADLKPLLEQQTSVLGKSTLVLNKEISEKNTFDKESLYFSPNELANLKSQPFVAFLVPFRNASFRVKAFTPSLIGIPSFQTDLFFESIPDHYLDIQQSQWKWDSTQLFIPIVIPESYLKLYNFGFAESQGLPVISEETASKITFGVELSGNGERQTFSSSIVGYSSKINSILVPENFLIWANKKFGRTSSENNASRLLVELSGEASEEVLEYLQRHRFSVNTEAIEFSKWQFFFYSIFSFVAVVALIIVCLSASSLLLSIDIIFQKNKVMLRNLYHIGYSRRRIAGFYQKVVCGLTFLTIVAAAGIAYGAKAYYSARTQALFGMQEPATDWILILMLTLLIICCPLYYFLIALKIKRLV